MGQSEIWAKIKLSNSRLFPDWFLYKMICYGLISPLITTNVPIKKSFKLQKSLLRKKQNQICMSKDIDFLCNFFSCKISSQRIRKIEKITKNHRINEKNVFLPPSLSCDWNILISFIIVSKNVLPEIVIADNIYKLYFFIVTKGLLGRPRVLRWLMIVSWVDVNISLIFKRKC